MTRCRARQAATAGPVPYVMRRANSNPLPRLEIRELQKDHDVWMLYILGLEQLQFINQSVETSWYGLTGVSTPSPGCRERVSIPSVWNCN